jgi:hypothetical protein
VIPVQRQQEPPEFDATVRRPGLSAIAELVGEGQMIARRGRKRRPVAERREDLKFDVFPPIWRNCTEHLMNAYKNICAYSCLYIEKTTGLPTVDHWAPKSRAWDRVYEWDNYRLACANMNARKRDFRDVMDPFEIEDGMFALDLVSFEAIPGPNAGKRTNDVLDTIKRLGLDQSDYKEDLSNYYHAYLDGEIKLSFLERRAPFLASELRRQNKLHDRDAGKDVGWRRPNSTEFV